MAEHSMCHPGLPNPQGDSHAFFTSDELFHNAKSLGFFLSSNLLVQYKFEKLKIEKFEIK